MAFKTSSIPKLPSIYEYSETVKKRDIFKLDKDLLNLKARHNSSKIIDKSSNFINNDLEDTKIVDFSNDFPIDFLDLTKNSNNVSKKNSKKPKKYLEMINEIENKVLEKYENIKQTTRSKSTSSMQRIPENPRALQLRDIREEASEELEDIDKLLAKKSDLHSDNEYLYYDMNKVKRAIKHKIENELLVPIMDRSRIFNKEKIRGQRIKKEEMQALKKNNRIGKEVEEILGRERRFYVKKLQEFYKREKITFEKV